MSDKPRKPDWIRVRLPASPASPEISRIKGILREHKLASVCEEALCPNLGECFGGGAAHFADCIRETRELNPKIKIEVLVPDFRGRMDVALDILEQEAPDVFNHNLETVPSLYKQGRPGSDFQWSLDLLANYKQRRPDVVTKSGLMLGLGEARDELVQVMRDMRAHNIDMLTLGQYLQPSREHLPVARFVPPEEFTELGEIAEQMGFKRVASGPLVRSSYHADQQVDLGFFK